MQSWCTWVDHDRLRQTETADERSLTYSFFCWQRTVIAHNIVHGNADGKGNASINRLAVHFFGVQFGGLSHNDSVPKLAQINYFGSGHTLRHDTLKRQIDYLGGFLVFGADITVMIMVETQELMIR